MSADMGANGKCVLLDFIRIADMPLQSKVEKEPLH
jgi:hypothetical protein